MKHTKKYILIIGMLLIQVYAPLVVFGPEVRSIETEGKLVFLVSMKHQERRCQHQKLR
ncbi:hypothetical protein IGK38_002990 [Enterococcus pernyi]